MFFSPFFLPCPWPLGDSPGPFFSKVELRLREREVQLSSPCSVKVKVKHRVWASPMETLFSCFICSVGGFAAGRKRADQIFFFQAFSEGKKHEKTKFNLWAVFMLSVYGDS
jgi:hypothetical protein